MVARRAGHGQPAHEPTLRRTERTPRPGRTHVMSASLSTRSRSPAAHPTRQQLDELDAMLKRMLELPVNQIDEELAAARAAARPPAPPQPPPAPGPEGDRPGTPAEEGPDR